MSVVAVFGGSFDPPHVGHQMVTFLALEVADVDRVVWVPTARHAFGKELSPFLDRVEMCKLATERFGDAVLVSKIEATLPVPSRTVHTLEALSDGFPGSSFRLLIGADILAEREKWLDWQRVTELAPPLVVAREGCELGSYAAEALPPVPPVSSTDIRDRLSRSQSAVPLVSRAVMDYIADRELYR